MSDSVKEAALQYVYGLGISCFPLVSGKKTPSVDSWKSYQERRPTGDEIVIQWPMGGNLGIVTGAISRLVVVDCESVDDATWFWKTRGQTKAVVETPRGIHFYFKHPGQHVGNAQRVKDESGKPRYDVRGDGGYVVAPPSAVVEGEGVSKSGVYRWRDGKQLTSVELLPTFNPEWRPVARSAAFESKKYTDGIKYISSIRAVSGQGGHNDTWRAVNVLRDSGITEAEALAAMVEWNATNADPPWTVAELLHKVRDAYSGE